MQNWNNLIIIYLLISHLIYQQPGTIQDTAEIITVSSDGKPGKAESGLSVIADISTKDVNTEESDLFFLPEGDYKKAHTDTGLTPLLKKLNSEGRIIAGICGGADILAAAGQSFIELGCEIEMRMHGTTKEQMREDYKFWKNKDPEWEKELYS